MAANSNWKPISFDAGREEVDIIRKIVDRAMEIAKRHDVDYDRRTALMDITACHCNGTPLHLRKLLEADDFTFAHDIYGIRRHINRENGQLEDCFVPRTARPQHVRIEKE